MRLRLRIGVVNSLSIVFCRLSILAFGVVAFSFSVPLAAVGPSFVDTAPATAPVEFGSQFSEVPDGSTGFLGFVESEIKNYDFFFISINEALCCLVRCALTWVIMM